MVIQLLQHWCPDICQTTDPYNRLH